jgi:uncharacterized membrane protein (UPF0127 family)
MTHMRSAAAAATTIFVAVALMLLYHLFAPPTPSFTSGNRTYAFTYVAFTPAEWESGLMNKTVTNSTFELFIFPKPAVYPFWMKNTYYPLDIIWINGSTVAYVAHAVPCLSYNPGQSNCTIYNTQHAADYVIEAHAGFANRTGIRAGSIVRIVS